MATASTSTAQLAQHPPARLIFNFIGWNTVRLGMLFSVKCVDISPMPLWKANTCFKHQASKPHSFVLDTFKGYSSSHRYQSLGHVLNQSIHL
jgi:hypothetical protein